MTRRNQSVKKISQKFNKDTKVVGWNMTAEDAIKFMESLNKTVVTFVGYSGAGYEDQAHMENIVRSTLSGYSPEEAVVNLGATEDGIGSVYDLVKGLGYSTTGIVSRVSLEYVAGFSDTVDYICFIDDDKWGGFLEGGAKCSPTSEAMVRSSDIMIGIGGGEISRDELTYAKRLGIPVEFFPADMNHQITLRMAKIKGLPKPKSFKGAAHEAFVSGDETE